jgi:hypothetical protein
MRSSLLRAITFAVFTVLMLASIPGSAEPLAAVLEPYLRIQEQLAADSVEGVRSDANLVAQAAAKMGADAQRVSGAARQLATAATTLDGARKAFATLSEEVIAYAEKTKTPLGPEVFTVHCPMAKATWLQKGEQVRNPHYGKSMLSCGEIKKRPGA